MRARQVRVLIRAFPSVTGGKALICRFSRVMRGRKPYGRMRYSPARSFPSAPEGWRMTYSCGVRWRRS